MDRVTLILVIILLFILGIYGLSQIGGDSTGDAVRSSNSYPAQYSGGGCGR